MSQAVVEPPGALDASTTTESKPARPRWRLSRAQLIGFGGLAALSMLPIPFGDFGFFIGQYALIYAIIGFSVVVVTGYSGLISLMPYSFAGIGAVVVALAVASWGWPYWLAVPLATVATVPISVFVGIASVRLKGLYLAIATLTFSNALGETFFKWDAATGGAAGWLVERPTLGPFSLASDVGLYIFCLICMFFLLWMVEGLRTSRTGRAMLAVKDNELEAQALGINVYKTKLVAFVLSGLIAGFGGSLLALLLTSVTPSAFQSPLAEATSILLVTLVAIGGMDRAIGPLFGAVTLVVQQQVFQGAEFFFAFVGIYAAVVLILFMMFRPGGIVEVGKRLVFITRHRPVLGTAIIAVILITNVGGAWLFLHFS